jgi:hypothetical protein
VGGVRHPDVAADDVKCPAEVGTASSQHGVERVRRTGRDDAPAGPLLDTSRSDACRSRVAIPELNGDDALALNGGLCAVLAGGRDSAEPAELLVIVRQLRGLERQAAFPT